VAKKVYVNQLAGIEYHGLPGITSHCLKAIVRLIHFGETIEKAALLSCENEHAFILMLEYDRPIGIKAGFSSGYPGEGPTGLSLALLLLERHCEEIEEYSVPKELMGRLNSSSLLKADMDFLKRTHPLRPVCYHDYIFERHYGNTDQSSEELIRDFERGSSEVIAHPSHKDRLLNKLFPKDIPFGIVDDRIIDLVFKFKTDPDSAILTAYKRLEGIIRRKIGGSEKSGSTLISEAFLKDNSPLQWEGEHPTEQKGRAQLFVGSFMAYRNRRAHREVRLDNEDELREFLLVNELYCLESAASLREPDFPSNAAKGYNKSI
tara:strand:- start:3154 stop:4110 length:957 start_codon:yes stop_codon:yes gene_type:complete